jgi:hypothetical protein
LTILRKTLPDVKICHPNAVCARYLWSSCVHDDNDLAAGMTHVSQTDAAAILLPGFFSVDRSLRSSALVGLPALSEVI